jgi:hypothetical protein
MDNILNKISSAKQGSDMALRFTQGKNHMAD